MYYEVSTQVPSSDRSSMLPKYFRILDYLKLIQEANVQRMNKPVVLCIVSNSSPFITALLCQRS